MTSSTEIANRFSSSHLMLVPFDNSLLKLRRISSILWQSTRYLLKESAFIFDSYFVYTAARPIRSGVLKLENSLLLLVINSELSVDIKGLTHVFSDHRPKQYLLILLIAFSLCILTACESNLILVSARQLACTICE